MKSTNPERTRRGSRETGIASFNALIRACKSEGRATLFCHQNADPDSACSALALESLLLKVAPKTETSVLCPQGISGTTKRLILNTELNLPSERLSTEDFGASILVDTNNLAQLGAEASGRIVRSSRPIIIVDHHHRHPDMENLVSVEIVDSSSSSTAEIVASLYRAAGKKLDLNMSEALLAAVFVETRSFALANSKTFQSAAFLAASGADPRRLPGLVGLQTTRPERIARIKAASRLRLETVGQWLVVLSEVGSYQSSVARALLSIGGDFAIVAGRVKGNVRVSLRATELFHEQTGVHLARDITIPLGTGLSGSGGGHPTAAGMTVTGTAQGVLQTCLERLRGLIEKGGLQA